MLVPLKAAAREAERWRREKEAKRAIITASIKERAERQRLAREAEAAEREAEAAERERVVGTHGIHWQYFVLIPHDHPPLTTTTVLRYISCFM